jgi:hypothetical protein
MAVMRLKVLNMISKLFFSIFILSTGLGGRNGINDKLQDSYIKDTKRFIYWYIKETRQDSILLSDQAGGHFFRGCERELMSDTTILSYSERREIQAALDSPKLQNWTGDLVGKKVRLVSKDTIQAIFKGKILYKDWDVFYSRYGKRLLKFSAPIFLRNRTLCIFYNEEDCGNTCGSGEVDVYKNDGDGWKLVKTLCSWMS